MNRFRVTLPDGRDAYVERKGDGFTVAIAEFIFNKMWIVASLHGNRNLADAAMRRNAIDYPEVKAVILPAKKVK